MSNKLTIEERILRIEKQIPVSVQGTILQRILTETGKAWSLGLGGLQEPKVFFIGDDINICLEKAEKEFVEL
jgi:hypothetical protein